MFSPIYPRLEGNVPPPPQDWDAGALQMESDIARLPEWRRWFCSVTFMFSPIYLRLEDVPPPSPRNYTWIWDKPGQRGRWVHFTIYPHPSSTWSYAWQGNLWISISDGYLKFADGKNQKKIFFNQCQIWVGQCTPPPPPRIRKKILSKVRFELADVPPPRIRNFFYLKLDLSWPM